MIRNLYVVKDDVAGTFDFYGVFPIDAVAERSFKTAVNSSPVPASDLSLYRIGSYDSETGLINDMSLEFLLRGEKNEV